VEAFSFREAFFSLFLHKTRALPFYAFRATACFLHDVWGHMLWSPANSGVGAEHAMRVVGDHAVSWRVGYTLPDPPVSGEMGWMPCAQDDKRHWTKHVSGRFGGPLAV
jgi:hypothetical protein